MAPPLRLGTSPHAPQQNLLNDLRLVGATLVLFSHAYVLSGRSQEEPLTQWVGVETGGGIGVAMFFVISGYLVYGSWEREPRVGVFLWKRGLRLIPALVVVVLLSVFVFGPLVSQLQSGEYFSDSRTWKYLSNAVLRVQYRLPGVFENNPYPQAVNGSLWTLPIEAVMYLSLLVAGRCGLLVKNRAIWIAAICLAMHVRLCDALGLTQAVWLEVLPVKESFKLATLFFAGAAMWQLDRVIPWRGDIAALLFVILFSVSRHPAGGVVWLLVAPYLVLYVGRQRIPCLSDIGRIGDFSYGLYLYAFPVQQTLMWHFGPSLPIFEFVFLSFAVTICFAVPSWYLVERPCLTLKSRLRERQRIDEQLVLQSIEVS